VCPYGCGWSPGPVRRAAPCQPRHPPG
jgi:hypothetical protein